MTSAVALLDANVLYPASLRDLLLQLAVSGFYRARWSAAIDEEWSRNLLAHRPGLADKIARTRVLMHRAVPDALVTGYGRIIPNLALPDPDDRHVLAAGIIAGADMIVTFNTRDFPAVALAPHGLIAQHPDVFLCGLITAQPLPFLAVVRTCFARLVHPPISAVAYVDALRRLGLRDTVLFLESNPDGWQ